MACLSSTRVSFIPNTRETANTLTFFSETSAGSAVRIQYGSEKYLSNDLPFTKEDKMRLHWSQEYV